MDVGSGGIEGAGVATGVAEEIGVGAGVGNGTREGAGVGSGATELLGLSVACRCPDAAADTGPSDAAKTRHATKGASIRFICGFPFFRGSVLACGSSGRAAAAGTQA
jgi:hypothetical protein